MEETLNEELDQIIIEELENEEKLNKQFHSTLEYNIISIDRFAKKDFRPTSTASDNTQNIMIETELRDNFSTRDPKRSLVPI